MSEALAMLRECAETQKRLFLSQFMSTQKIGEINCINGFETDDTIIFERFEVNGLGFVVCFRLLSEDALDAIGKKYEELPVQQFLERKNEEMRAKYNFFLESLKEEGKTLDQVRLEVVQKGGDASSLDFKALTRDELEDTMHAGRKRINGDRNSRIEILQRHTEIPNDLQKPALSAYVLPMPAQIKLLLPLTESEEREEWKDSHLVPMIRDQVMGCHLPMMKDIVDVYPIIYRFPAKELDVSKAANL